jgi:hypothetical protein
LFDLERERRVAAQHTTKRIIPLAMSFEGSNKRSGIPVSSGDGNKRLRITNDSNEESIASFDKISLECNARILQFLDVDDLANSAQVSRRFHKNSLHPSLPQNRTAMLTCIRRFVGQEYRHFFLFTPASLAKAPQQGGFGPVSAIHQDQDDRT